MMLEWILSSCVLILVVLALRAGLGKRISAGLRYALWAVVLLRLLVPVQLFNSPVAGLPVPRTPELLEERSIYVLPVQRSPVKNAAVTVRDGTITADANSFGYPRLEDGGETVVRYANRVSPLQVIEWLWLAGSCLTALALAISNLRFSRRLCRVRRPLEGERDVYVAEGLPSPCLFGLLRPKVYVTPQAAEDPTILRHVLVHERTHRRHLDHLWSALRGVALALHWWNPLVWATVILSRQDGELACDESALKQLGDGERAAYGETLLSLLTAKPGPRDLLCCATTMTGGKRSLKERIRRIACEPKRLVSAAAAVICLLAVTVVCTFGRAVEVEGAPAGQSVSSQVLDCAPDLNHNGVTEQVELRQWSEDRVLHYELRVLEGEDLLWSQKAGEAHEDWAAIFLTRVDGEDYLLRYRPYTSAGACDYQYTLFSLEQGETVEVHEELRFDYNFSSNSHQNFSPQTIAAFVGRVNGYLETSVELLNTDGNLLLTFEKEGQLRDTIFFLNRWSGYDARESLEQNLSLFQAYTVDHPDDVYGGVEEYLATLTAADIGDINGQNATDARELTRLLRAASASRNSRLYDYRSFDEGDVLTFTGEQWDVPMTDGSTLHLVVGQISDDSVYIVHEDATGAPAAFFTAPELHQVICSVGDPYNADILDQTPDLNRDGIPERLEVREWGDGQSLQVYQDGSCLWSAEALTAHIGWYAYFLTELDGEDYLLCYQPGMWQGRCFYQYSLFYLDGTVPVAADEDQVEFDINFEQSRHQFDPAAIAAFMEKINNYLANSVQLINTDGNLLRTFAQEGALVDTLWWLEEDGFTPDADRSLEENLAAYHNAMMDRSSIASVDDILSSIRAENIASIDYSETVTAENLAAALNGAVGKWRVCDGDVVEGFWEGVYPYWAVYAEYVVPAWSTSEQAISLEAGLTENLVCVTCSGYLHDNGYSHTVLVEDENLYWLVRRAYDYPEQIERGLVSPMYEAITEKMEGTLQLAQNGNPEAGYTGYELTEFYTLATLDGIVSGAEVTLYQNRFALTLEHPEKMVWAGGVYLDSQLREEGFYSEDGGLLAVVWRDGTAEQCRFLAGDFYPALEDAEWMEEYGKPYIANALADPDFW